MQLVKNKTKKKIDKNKKTLYGDTIVEAIVAIAIYSIVAVLALGSMSSGLSSAQRNLESTMSRSAIDSQSDTLRYFYENYLQTKGKSVDNAYYEKIWARIKPGNESNLDPYSLDDPSLSDYTCEALIQADEARVESDRNDNANSTIFVLSGRGAQSSVKLSNDFVYGLGQIRTQDAYVNLQVLGPDRIKPAPLYPRLAYKNMNFSGTTISDEDSAMSFLLGDGGQSDDGGIYYQSKVAKQAEGVWIYPKATGKGYDFYVRTCWNPVGSKTPSTFTSVVRLYNADI